MLGVLGVTPRPRIGPVPSSTRRRAGRCLVALFAVAALSTFGPGTAAHPVTVDPKVGPERPVADPVPTPADGRQSLPAVAFGASTDLVVWEDERPGAVDNSDNSDVFAARVSPSGVVLDPTGIPIAVGAHAETAPAVAWNGSHFLVVWEDARSDSGGDIYAARVGANGAVLDPGGFAVSATANPQDQPAVAAGAVGTVGPGFLVAWVEHRPGTGSDALATRVTSSGTVLDPAGIDLEASATADVSAPLDVAWNGTTYLVVASAGSGTERDIYGSRVSPAGAVLGIVGISAPAPGFQGEPGVTSDGSNFLVAWRDNGPSSFDGSGIVAARVSATGTVLDPGGIDVQRGGDPVLRAAPDAAWDGEHFLVTWTSQAICSDLPCGPVEIQATLLSPAGGQLTVIGMGPFGGRFGPSAVASDGTNFFVVWERSDEIVGGRLFKSEFLDPEAFLVSKSTNTQRQPGVAFDGTNFLVVWTDNRAGPGDPNVFAGRVSAVGRLLDGAGIAIATTSAGEGEPVVAWSGTSFLVVYQHQSSGILAKRVSPSGTVLDPTPIAVSGDPGGRPAVAWNGTSFLVAWESSGSDIVAARLSPAGTVLDSPPVVISASTDFFGAFPAVASNGSDFLVAWADNRAGFDLDILGARVSGAGVVLDPAGIPIATGTNVQLRPAVAFTSPNYLVVWEDFDATDVFGARVSPGGVLVDLVSIPISTAPGTQDQPDVAANGSFLVLWRDRRSASGFDVFGARVNGDGTVTDPNGFAISAAPTDDGAAAVTAGAGNQWGVAYERFAPEQPYGATRAFLRTVAPK